MKIENTFDTIYYSYCLISKIKTFLFIDRACLKQKLGYFPNKYGRLEIHKYTTIIPYNTTIVK